MKERTTLPNPLTKPIIHLNGSSARSLLEDNRNACRAVDEARDVLCSIAPHPRDYYVSQDPEAYNKAREEHFVRIRKLESVMNDLDIIAMYLMEHVKN